jgi:hypothetical protein
MGNIFMNETVIFIQIIYERCDLMFYADQQHTMDETGCVSWAQIQDARYLNTSGEQPVMLTTWKMSVHSVSS